MLKSIRFWSLAAFGLLAAVGTPAAFGQGVIVYGPTPVPTAYSVPVRTVVTRSYVTRTPIGPTAYVAPAPYYVVAPGRQVVTTTTVVPDTTYVPTTTYLPAATQTILTDPALTPVGYEIIRPNGRVKVVYPRRVYRYGY
ncbi:MAG: hypothetical protein JWN86_4762 [Planctomycetota bacterium]|nr:hypothetical protein [Planctomycetota bacterium]